MACVFQDAEPTKKSIHRKSGTLGSNCTVTNSPRARGTTSKCGKQRVHRQTLIRSAHLMSAIRTPPSLRRGHTKKPCTKKGAPAAWKHCNKNNAPAEMHGKWQKIHKLEKGNHRRFYLLSEVWSLPAPSLKKLEEREFAPDSSKIRTKLRRTGNPSKIQNLPRR